MVNSSSNYKRSSSTSRPRRDKSTVRKSRNSSSKRIVTDDEDDDYLINEVVAFEEFGEAQEVMKLFQFKDKKRTTEQLKRNVVIKIEVSASNRLHLVCTNEYMSALLKRTFLCHDLGHHIRRHRLYQRWTRSFEKTFGRQQSALLTKLAVTWSGVLSMLEIG